MAFRRAFMTGTNVELPHAYWRVVEVDANMFDGSGVVKLVIHQHEKARDEDEPSFGESNVQLSAGTFPRDRAEWDKKPMAQVAYEAISTPAEAVGPKVDLPGPIRLVYDDDGYKMYPGHPDWKPAYELWRNGPPYHGPIIYPMNYRGAL